ncbi:unnamed protein product [Arctogadus glacialis]
MRVSGICSIVGGDGNVLSDRPHEEQSPRSHVPPPLLSPLFPGNEARSVSALRGPETGPGGSKVMEMSGRATSCLSVYHLFGSLYLDFATLASIAKSELPAHLGGFQWAPPNKGTGHRCGNTFVAKMCPRPQPAPESNKCDSGQLAKTVGSLDSPRSQLVTSEPLNSSLARGSQSSHQYFLLAKKQSSSLSSPSCDWLNEPQLMDRHRRPGSTQRGDSPEVQRRAHDQPGPRPTGPQTNGAPDQRGPRPTGPQTHRAPDPPGPRPTGPQTNRPPEPPGPRPTGGVERAVEEKAGC